MEERTKHGLRLETKKNRRTFAAHEYVKRGEKIILATIYLHLENHREAVFAIGVRVCVIEKNRFFPRSPRTGVITQMHDTEHPYQLKIKLHARHANNHVIHAVHAKTIRAEDEEREDWIPIEHVYFMPLSARIKKLDKLRIEDGVGTVIEGVVEKVSSISRLIPDHAIFNRDPRK